MVDKFADEFCGAHSDEDGIFDVYWDDVEGGWMWCPEGGEPEGPYETSECAFKAAKNLDFSINHH